MAPKLLSGSVKDFYKKAQCDSKNDLIMFFVQQAKAGLGSGVRPGGNRFPGLLKESTLLMCFWGFHPAGSSFAPKISGLWFFLCSLLSFVLSIMAALGIYDLFRRKEWGFAATFIILFAGALYMIFGQEYSYGAYKLILLNWWAMAFAVILGVDKLLALPPRRGRFKGLITGCGLCVFVLFFCLNGAMLVYKDRSLAYKSILPFKKVAEIKDVIGSKPVLVDVNGNIANEWAVFFLRNVPISLAQYRAYMALPHVIPYMKRARKVDVTEAKYALIDSKESFEQAHLIWKGGPYYLWKLDKSRLLKPPPEAVFEGFGHYDFLRINKRMGSDGRKDAIIKVVIHATGKIIRIEVRNISGQHSVWNTIPNNRCALLGVAEADKPDKLINKSDGSVDIHVEDPAALILYLADNGSIKGGRTQYEVSITFSDGRVGRVPLQGI